jgi:hypothetical protein
VVVWSSPGCTTTGGFRECDLSLYTIGAAMADGDRRRRGLHHHVRVVQGRLAVHEVATTAGGHHRGRRLHHEWRLVPSLPSNCSGPRPKAPVPRSACPPLPLTARPSSTPLRGALFISP